jgi:hypothetical protein
LPPFARRVITMKILSCGELLAISV